MKRVVILGATSAIAQEVARLFALRGDALHLVARSAERLQALAADLRTRGASAVSIAARDLNLEPEAVIAEAWAAQGGCDVLLLAHGILGDPSESDRSPAAAELVLRTNLLGPVSLLTLAAQRLERGACIAALSSVAGDRGRKKNGVYGASKAGLDSFLSALRQRLFERDVCVLTLKPGFVDTPMTAHMPRNALFARPADVARGIVRAIDARRDVVYLPWFWRYIMEAIRRVPERLFKKLSI